jgi:ketosteroid isomerase-like protein
MEHPNATRMRRTIGAFTAGDMPLLLEGFAPDVVWYAPGDTPASGRFRGREGVRRFFAMMDEVSGGSLRIEVDDVLAGERYVTIFLTITAQRHGERMSVVVAQFAAIDEHGDWSRCWFLPDKLDEWNRFFAGADSERH